MLVTLFGKKSINKTILPMTPQGSYWITDANNKKMINIEENCGNWQITSNSLFQIINPQNVKLKNDEIAVISDEFAVIKRVLLKKDGMYFITLANTNDIYLLYCTDVYDKETIHLDIKNFAKITIGRNPECDISYDNVLLSKEHAYLFYENKKWKIKNLDQKLGVFVNNVQIYDEERTLENGDIIFIVGLKLIFMGNGFFINNPSGKVKYLLRALLLNKNSQKIINQEDDSNEEIELYSEKDYFSRAPRIVDKIEREKIEIDAPPKLQEDNEMPAVLALGSTLSMGVMMMISMYSTIDGLTNEKLSLKESIPKIVMAIAMLIAMIVFPIITKQYEKYQKKKYEKKRQIRYKKYINSKIIIVNDIMDKQRKILNENYISPKECEEIVLKKDPRLWERKIEDNEFLSIRLGYGNVPLDIDVSYPRETFTMEDDNLVEILNMIAKKSKILEDAPIAVSLVKKNVSSIVVQDDKTKQKYIKKLIMQLVALHSYIDLKLVFFVKKDKENEWEYIKMLPHIWSTDMQIRFFADDYNDVKQLSKYLEEELELRAEKANDKTDYKEYMPYYLIITDDYKQIENLRFISNILKLKVNLGFSLLCITNDLTQLPNECKTFVTIENEKGKIFESENSSSTQNEFKIDNENNWNFAEVSKVLANIPIKYSVQGSTSLPNTYTFLEMYDVGRIEQLNILDRWKSNDSTMSLQAPIGIDANGMPILLDIHEKYHGPHGLIAGSTGSGKSEFIITYILSLAINYHPNDVNFVLIDYKGGGLAGAFENKMTGVYLPHLAGTITNLDKAEMDRTLVSIDSEVKRRQAKFNEARDKLGESTIDIYKYENFYREGKLTEPIPHLFIICDEFAELKAQQPEFMDNLISVARIGRSLGVHLILATQKPSGVVNDQIWSNTKFRVCLKVASEADSKEMLKRPEAAHIKQAGRFYLQVGMDEIFELGQSGYCGAKYFPSDKVIKTVDKSVNFINDCGQILKSVKPSSGNSKQAQGEQIAAIMKEIIAISKQTNKKADRLWLENIPPVILIDEIIKKYNIKRKENSLDVEAIIGEYDIPENQEQGLLKYNYLADGNAIIYGLDSTEKELLLKSIIYSTTLYYKPEEINHYIIDYGSESLKIFEGIPHVGGVVLSADEEKFNNLIKLIKEEINSRKKILSNYGGEFENYQKSTNNKLPIISIIINNYPGIIEAHDSFNYDEFPALTRDSERYGIVFIVTTTGSSSISQKIVQNFKKMFAFKLKDIYEYLSIFNTKKKLTPRDNEGRGIFKSDNTHEFQTAYIINPDENLNDYLLKYRDSLKEKYKETAKRIPELPLIVRFENIKNEISTIEDIPIGISKNDMEVVKYNFKEYNGTLISAYKLGNTDKFIISLIQTLSCIKNNVVLTIDGTKKFELLHNYVKNLYNDKLKESFEAIDKYFDKVLENNNQSLNYIIVIYGFGKFLNEVETKKFDDFFKKVKNAENIRFIVVETPDKIKEFIYEQWFKSLFNLQYGIYVGKGIADQNVLKINSISKEFKLPLNNNMGYKLEGGENTCIKLIDYVTKDGEEDE